MIRTVDLIKRVATREGELTILAGISLEIARAQSVAVAGASGSGKSTLLALMAGLDVATSGEVILDGHRLSTLDEEQRAALRARYIGFVFQSFHLLPGLTALENVMLPIELAGQGQAKTQAKGVLERVGLGERLNHYPGQLSGGEQQRVAMARAFATRAPVLFADEPTGNLDTDTGARVIDLLFDLNREFETTLVLVTHDVRLAERCDRLLHLEGGRIVEAAAGEGSAHGS